MTTKKQKKTAEDENDKLMHLHKEPTKSLLKNLPKSKKNPPKIDERTHNELTEKFTKKLAEERAKNDKLAKEPTEKTSKIYWKIYINAKNQEMEYTKTPKYEELKEKKTY
ncbi:14624_t:CDS:2 [Dentiscutata erythropus]|uniref:14624_t:CDS:1 n=1 Tax=Dentiscutata erythropus TaxID=1348616 RepID=A0A9N9FAU7_9GLOM|nr:14624_t:CDS:2 [Dentiscutata erythropus]